MAIRIPSKNEKLLAQMRDALRILAWQSYKADNDATGLEAYAVFNEEWQADEIQKLDIIGLKKYVAQLGYTLVELSAIRKEYYAMRNGKSFDNDKDNDKDNAIEPAY